MVTFFSEVLKFILFMINRKKKVFTITRKLSRHISTVHVFNEISTHTS